MNFAIRCTNRCNLNCEYCYAKAYMAQVDMTPETVERSLREVARFCDGQEVIDLNWTGGEPLILDHGFWWFAMEVQRDLQPQSFNNILQSNLILLGDWHIPFVKQHFSEVRTSLDYPPEQHNGLRREGNFDETVGRIQLLKDEGIFVNTNTVITQMNVGLAAEMYRFLRDLGIESISVSRFIPEGNGSARADLAVEENRAFADFLIELYDVWVDDPIKTVKRITPLDKLIRTCKGSPVPCFHCQEQLLAIGPQGEIFPSCNKFLVHPDTMLGNIADMHIEDALASVRRAEVSDKIQQGIKFCGDCEFFSLCKGGCFFVAYENADDIDGMTREQYCKGYHHVFRHILGRGIPTP